ESNVRTAFLCAKAVSAPMREARSGRIVNVSSSTAAFGMADFLHYVTAKAGIVGMTRSMARELGPYGVAVNAVAPGLVRTERGVADLGADYFERVAAGQCLREPIEIDDVCEAVKFLASGSARMITGQTLLVNGGASMGPF
ncbi:MAG: SDR family NAD(P)-dependent oxidoreductase, partial [Nocardioidaceae bacterium]